MTGPLTYHEAMELSLRDQVDRYEELTDRDLMARSIATLRARGEYDEARHRGPADCQWASKAFATEPTATSPPPVSRVRYVFITDILPGSIATAILESIVDDRPQADRILVAQITGEARHRARWRDLTEDEEGQALAELRALAGGRADLLAQVAGIFEGTSAGEPDEPLARSAARLCRKAGADPEAIPAWIEEGRRRKNAARRPPFSRQLLTGRRGQVLLHHDGRLRRDRAGHHPRADHGRAGGS
jgi:hypothetical protein